MDCIPQAKYDSWGHYQWVGEYAETPEWANTYVSSQKIGFLKAAVNELKCDLEIYLSTKSTAEDIDTFFQPKSDVNKVLVSQLQDVEDFCEKRRVAKLNQTVGSKVARKDFYEMKAGSLDPPINIDILKGCESYQRAIAISRPPVDLARSWRTLLPKIKAEAARITAEPEMKKKAQDLIDFRYRLYCDYKYTMARSASNKSPEFRFVHSIADTVIEEMRLSEMKTFDMDLIPLILQGVYEAYQLSDPKPPQPGGKGSYRLLMDDARMVYQFKIRPLFERLDSDPRGQAKSLQCVHCHIPKGKCSSKSMPTFDFDTLLEHVFEEHRSKPWSFNSPLDPPIGLYRNPVAEHDRMVSTQATVKFLWYCLDWPKRLPLRPKHRMDLWDRARHTTEWDAEGPEYERLDPQTAEQLGASDRAFYGPGPETLDHLLLAMLGSTSSS